MHTEPEQWAVELSRELRVPMVYRVSSALIIQRALRTGQLIHAVPSETCPSLNGCGYCTEHGCPRAQPSVDEVEAARKFKLGDRVTKTKGSSWTGLVVGFYSTSLTPIGYAVESENEPGSVQIYPESALAQAVKDSEK